LDIAIDGNFLFTDLQALVGKRYPKEIARNDTKYKRIKLQNRAKSVKKGVLVLLKSS